MNVDDELDDHDDEHADPLTDDLVKVFACSHTFHMKCLKRTYRKKLSA